MMIRIPSSFLRNRKPSNIRMGISSILYRFFWMTIFIWVDMTTTAIRTPTTTTTTTITTRTTLVVPSLKPFINHPLWNTIPRGGSSSDKNNNDNNDDQEILTKTMENEQTSQMESLSSLPSSLPSSMNNNNNNNDPLLPSDHHHQRHPVETNKLQTYRMQQQYLLQLRATILTEALAGRGLPIPTLKEVATPEGMTIPQIVDWDCALSTREEPKSCLYSFDAEPNTKVLAPIDTNQWISIQALNRLRRTDPTKVEPMWHSQYAILSSWFDDPESPYSLLQHVGMAGFVLHAVLQGIRLHMLLALGLAIVTILFMPWMEYIVNRMLVSGLLWSKWTTWGRFIHAALPLKLLLGQMIFKLVATAFLKLVAIVKERLVEWECQLLEQSIPLTVGPGSNVHPHQHHHHHQQEEVEEVEDHHPILDDGMSWDIDNDHNNNNDDDYVDEDWDDEGDDGDE